MSDYLYKDMPKLGFGLMRLPTIPGGTQKDIDFDKVQEMVDLFMSRGFHYFDTAFVYHEWNVSPRSAETSASAISGPLLLPIAAPAPLRSSSSGTSVPSNLTLIGPTGVIRRPDIQIQAILAHLMAAQTAVGKQDLHRHWRFLHSVADSQPGMRRVRPLPSQLAHRRRGIGNAPKHSHFPVRSSPKQSLSAFDDLFCHLFHLDSP